jgi:3-oxoadipate enol-lactonase
MTTGILFIHAFPLDGRMWEGQRRALGHVPQVAPDLPGFGGSDPAGEVLSMGLAADRCTHALDAVGFDRAIVVGLSMGGYVAFELWRRDPERIGGLVLANTRSQADPPEGVETRRALAARLLAEGNGFLADAPPPLLSDEAPQELRDRVRAWILDQPAAAIAAASLGLAERPDSTPTLPTIDVPTLVVSGDRDTLIPSEVSLAMAEQIPGAGAALIEGAGHLSNLERPEEFTALLATHLAACGVAV